MRLVAIESTDDGITLAIMEGGLERAARRASYRSIANAMAKSGQARLLIDQSRLAEPHELDIDFDDWDHADIAEELKSAGATRIAVVDAGRDALPGYLVMALRRCGIAVFAAPDVKSAHAWLQTG